MKEGWPNTSLSIYAKTVGYHVANFQKMSSGEFKKQLKLSRVK